MRVIIASGGTGGHLYPAILIGKELERMGEKVLFTVGKRKTELRIVKSMNVNYRVLPLVPPSNRFFHYPSILLSLFTAFSVIKGFKPDRVVGTGSYTAFPILFWAKLLGIPIYLHEQNTIPGKVTKIFAKYAKKIFISFPETKKYIKNGKTVFTGLPVREIDIESDCSKLLREMELDKKKPVFLAFGGSQGSHVLLKMLKEVEKEIQKMGLQGIIVKGNVELTFKYDFPYVLKEYIYDMPSFYKISDFVIARGGASTIWELINARKPAIIIPIKGNLHQFKNALFFKELGGGYVVEEEDIQSFINSISYLLDKKEEFIKNLKSFNIPDWRVILNKEMKNA